MTENSSSVLTPYIKSLFLETPNLTPNDLATVLKCIFKGIPSDVQTAAFLTALRMRELDHKPEFITAAVNTILEVSTAISPENVGGKSFIDIVGTGGDGKNAFNVSTSSSIVAAGMGLPICKHGGKTSTSNSGAGDILTCLDVNLMKVSRETLPSLLKKSNYCFLFAPSFHSAMGKVARVRSNLGIPTIFNILGPLINPVPLKARILGVYNEALGESYASAASLLNKENKTKCTSMVVFGKIGLDEISPIGPTKCWLVDTKGDITTFIISPKDFNLPEHSLLEVRSGSPKENAATLIHILRQDLEIYRIHDDPKNNHPIVNFILLNSAALAVLAGLTDNWAEGVELAKTAILTGSSLSSFEKFRSAVQEIN